MKGTFFVIGAMFVAFACLCWSGTSAAQAPPDDVTTIILLLKPGADMNKVGKIISSVNGTVVKGTTIQATGQQMLKVQVPQGTATSAQSAITALADPDIIAVEKNYTLQVQGLRDQTRTCPPNDPDFPQQWALPDLHFPEALCRAEPSRIPAMTYIDTGVNPVYPFELFLIHQYNFADGAGGVLESPFDADTNANDFHGTTTAGTGGATTNDHEFIAGVASAGEPVFITMLRVAAPPGTTITTADLSDAVAWCIDHQRERGKGRGLST